MASINKIKDKKSKNVSEDSIPSFIRKTYEILEVTLFSSTHSYFQRKDNTTTSFGGATMEPLLSLAILQNLHKKFFQHTLSITI